jgi:hypothetical protein
MGQSHHKTLAKSPSELWVRGSYMEICIERIILDATVVFDSFNLNPVPVVLFEAVFSNLSEYRIGITSPAPLLIDSAGFQHSAYNWWNLGFCPTVCKSKRIEEGTNLPRIASEIEGKAKSLGWITFPLLKKSVVPHRLIFQFPIFDPGSTSGSVRHSETLELVFDLSLLGRLLKNGRKQS